MARPGQRMIRAAALVALVASLVAGASPARALEADDVDRVAGTDRVATAVAVSAEAFTAAETVVLARADAYADALAGAPLAAALGGPVLLTSRDALDPRVGAEIDRLGATDAVLLGGTAALGPEVEAALEDAGLTVRRLAGADRFATAAAIATEIAAGDSPDQVVVVEGQDADPRRGWPDALVAGAYAGFVQAPLLLVTTDAVPAATSAALADLAPGEVVVVGGTAAVSDATAAALGTDDRSVRRVAGVDRYATAGAVYDEALTLGLDPSTRWVATGRNWPDALTAAAAAGGLGEGLLLVDGRDATATPATLTRLGAVQELLQRILLVGGDAAITPASATAITTAVADEDLAAAAYCLTVLHNNDGESQLVNAGGGIEEFGGIARFAAVMRAEQAFAVADRDDGCESRAVLTVTSGDNFLAGPELAASLDKGVPWYDSIALDYIGYDALAIGNHDFDLTPDATADFIQGFESDAVFVSANLDVSAEPELDALADAGKIAPSVVIDTGAQDVGVIGITTPILRSISSPRDVEVDPDVAGAIAEQVDALEAQGVEVIVLISHLQDVDDDLALVPELSGVDIVVAGGGDEVLGDVGDLYVPGDQNVLAGSYPRIATDADGDTVPVVTTAGDYRYVGRLVTRFGADGELLDGESAVDDDLSRMVRVAGTGMPDGVTPDATVQAQVVDPVLDYVEALDENVIGTSQVALDGSRPAIRSQETNLGNLLADALLTEARERAADFGLDPAADFVSIQNGGGIRNNSVLPAGEITELDTFDVAPFPNFVGAFEAMTVAELKLALENGYSQVEEAGGKFAHIGGMSVEVDISLPAQARADDGTITEPGQRVRSITLDDGTVLLEDGAVVDGAARVTVVTIDFLARGGDDYPFPPVEELVTVGASYQQALFEFIATDLSGSITSAAYPEGGEGRITITGA